ncbi:cobalt/nickel transport system ATP-binding protein [Pseudonocardia thermophila]|uniref:ABC transporter ATP-binding protein n=1 Tax=Pseudonocardia thermophila TaxID=1848 RepID=A0A1M6QC68_PSETH|nr:ABC transporter ATP-binding protein [Pseudonocardia thermophila]SHK17673.1 cobalt/nickel transport system ATP-binding protein [Pseudonocardia thermophila]
MIDPPILEGRGLRHGYDRSRPPVLDGADVVIHPGRRTAVLGPNGGGKTTLFRLLIGLIEPWSGTVLLDGEPVRRTRSELTRLRQHVQLVLQDPDDQLFAADVAQDISFGPLNLGLPAAEVSARVADALAALEITDLADRPTHLLSFGQRKRVAIAGAVAMRPRLLILDEPTAGLDPAGVEALIATLDTLHASGTSVVLSTHDVDLAYRWADEVAVVAQGRVRQSSTAQLLADESLLAAARLGPAWGPAVERLLQGLGIDARPRTAAELNELLTRVEVRWQPGLPAETP